MKYKERDFTLELKEKIQCMEKEIERISFKLFKDYSHLYIEKNMELFIELIRDKEYPFETGYSSSISIAVLDEEGKMIEFYTVPIWECCNYFLGVPLQIRLWGSKLSGELVDESYCEIEEELKERLEEFLQFADEE
ncbi:hypothetical protein AB1I92_17890 [Bacillus mobilis]|uniref:DoxX n=2 Tax=Bacillus cereus group TaxID=86661 RepID=A0A1C4ESE8_BACCE|nr:MULTISPECIES: hypothetical protein [Bacillus cereus group]MCU5590572.1 hypothetical protein [Bacillus mobilis]MCU5734181.1 hypothetical protein [Bacillus mobilis]MCU9557320.1 hypothetical protein [Bacillus mobilis]OKA39716.1 hypothetical protein BJR06_05370 [Bacillus cereus]OKA42033.1 hypothetical protein BJR07_08990 [Bacillus cereus]